MCRPYFENFAKITEPFNHLTKDSIQLCWEEAQQNAFCGLQDSLQHLFLLAHFAKFAETQMHTDASDVGLGDVLVRKQNGYKKVISYASHGLSKEKGNNIGDF